MSRIAILAAMPEEIAGLQSELVVDGAATLRAEPGRASRELLAGTLWDVPVVLAWTQWGKVAAAITATHVLAAYSPSAVIFTGVAGGLVPQVAIGDVVVADSLVQHDVDASPIFPRHEIPLLGRSSFTSDEGLRTELAAAAAFGIHRPQVHQGQIASGDQFISDRSVAADLTRRLPAALCVEMEGAAVAHVCHEHEVPCGVLRIVSDRADADAGIDFPAFLAQVASGYTRGIMRRYLSGRG
jgi:adenosylhomocysteine nucleosidase